MSDANRSRIARLEAMLYASGRPVSLTILCAHLRLDSEKEVSALLSTLSEVYERDGSPLEIKELPEGRVVLQLKPDYAGQARRFSTKPLLTEGPLRTLSYVAYHQPVEQKEVAEARGGHAYGHLRMLEEMGLISREKKGRATVVRTTPDFADYLRLSRERSSMRRQLRRMFRTMELRELEKK